MLDVKQLGPFEIERELGSGAMGTVFKARYRESGQVVALKIIALGLAKNEHALARFEREAAILKQLRHPNIVRLFGTGRYKGTPYFAMEYVDGESIDHVLARRGRYTWEEVVDIGIQLCAALQHAHEKGIIHRDLKPSNLMVMRDGSGIKLTDFGIAKDTDVTALTAANAALGTAAYMSPEQCRGEKNLTAKSDLYSLGIVFYELLTGKKPFIAESPIDMFMQHVEGTFERPSRLALDIPIWLDTLVCQLMEKKPDHRPLDAAMVGRALEEIKAKALSQQSAGVDAATARVIDRKPTGIGNRDIDEADREAARALRSAVAKKKIRKKVKPFYQQTWFMLLGVVLAVATAFGVLYVITLPPSAEELAGEVEKALAAKSPSDVTTMTRAIQAVDRYLTVYGDSDSETTRKIKAQERPLKVELRELQLHRRFGKKMGPEEDDNKSAYETAQSAWSAENEGDWSVARTRWQDLVKTYTGASGGDLLWAWLAQKKLDDLTRAEKLTAEWLDREKADRLTRIERKIDADDERRVVQGLRLELDEKWDRARDHWAQLKADTDKDLEQRLTFLIAARHERTAKERIVNGDKP